MIREEDLSQLGILPFGYTGGGKLLVNSLRSRDTSWIATKNRFFHNVETRLGISRGPVWTKHQDGCETAIGI